MKKILIVFLALVMVFAGVWITKSKTPAMRPDSYANGLMEENAWFNKVEASGKVPDAKWQLDPEIPSNYIPVPGKDELYMVVDENGNIIKYRHRTKQADGTWVWEDVNPDIPENYEPVPGLKDVYKVTYPDGSVKYYKYIRNADDTFAFVEVDEHGNLIGYDAPEGELIPDNYEHVADNIYAVKDENGVTIGFRERTLDDMGNYDWEFVNAPISLNTNIGVPELNSNVNISIDGPGGLPGNMNTSDPQYMYVPVGVPVYVNPETGNQGQQGMPEGYQQTMPNMDGYVTTPPENSGGGFTESSDGTYTESESYYETATENGYKITYETTITKVFDQYGNILSSSKNGPYEVSREPASGSGLSYDDMEFLAP